jgi:hypothetical protein
MGRRGRAIAPLLLSFLLLGGLDKAHLAILGGSPALAQTINGAAGSTGTAGPAATPGAPGMPGESFNKLPAAPAPIMNGGRGEDGGNATPVNGDDGGPGGVSTPGGAGGVINSSGATFNIGNTPTTIAPAPPTAVSA